MAIDGFMIGIVYTPCVNPNPSGYGVGITVSRIRKNFVTVTGVLLQIAFGYYALRIGVGEIIGINVFANGFRIYSQNRADINGYEFLKRPVHQASASFQQFLRLRFGR